MYLSQKFVGPPGFHVSAIDLLLLGSTLQNLSLFGLLFEFSLHGARFSPNWPTFFPERHINLLQEIKSSMGPSMSIIMQVLINRGFSTPTISFFLFGYPFRCINSVRGSYPYASPSLHSFHFSVHFLHQFHFDFPFLCSYFISICHF